MRSFSCFALCALFLDVAVHGQEISKQVPIELLNYKRMEKLKGTWEMQVNSKGWKGTIYMRIMVALETKDGQFKDWESFCILKYTGKLARGKEVFSTAGVRGKNLTFAGIKIGQELALVAPAEPSSGPFQVKPAPELMAPFSVEGKKLTLDMSKSSGYFLPKKLAALELDCWSKSEWTFNPNANIGEK
jgi:hypothetical protein